MPGTSTVGRVRMITVGVLLGCLLLTSACTSDEPDEAQSSWHPPSPSPNWQKNDYRPGSVDDLCTSVSERALRTMGITDAAVDTDDSLSDSEVKTCSWTHEYDSSDYQVDRTLSVRYTAYEPPATRRDYTPTREAKYKFRVPDGWQGRTSSPVRGLGDDAKVSRHLELDERDGGVWLAVRHRNLVIDVRAESGDELGSIGHGSTPTLDALEAGARAAMTDILTRLELTAKYGKVPAAGDGEVTRAKAACDAVGGELTPPFDPHDTTEKGSPLSSGCAWTSDDLDGPELTVDVEVVTPSRLDGRSGTAIATGLFHDSYAKLRDGSKVGDETKVGRSSFEDERTIWVHARKGNLLVTVEYERSGRPSERTLERDATAVAKDVLEDYR